MQHHTMSRVTATCRHGNPTWIEVYNDVTQEWQAESSDACPKCYEDD